MYKITWSRQNDIWHKTYVLVPDAKTLFEAYFIITGYGRGDGCTPTKVTVTTLDGVIVDMTKGISSIPY